MSSKKLSCVKIRHPSWTGKGGSKTGLGRAWLGAADCGAPELVPSQIPERQESELNLSYSFFTSFIAFGSFPVKRIGYNALFRKMLLASLMVQIAQGSQPLTCFIV